MHTRHVSGMYHYERVRPLCTRHVSGMYYHERAGRGQRPVTNSLVTAVLRAGS